MTRFQPTSRLSTTVNALPTALEAFSDHVIFGSSLDVLEEIRRPEINLAVWRRDVPSVIAAWLRTSSAGGFLENCGDMDLQLPAPCAPASVAAHFATKTAEQQQAGIAALARDVGELAEIVSRISYNPAVRLRVEWVTDRACRYFHIDRVPFRLVCTYRGPGTEWVSNDVAARLTTPESAPAAHDINRLGAGDVAIMRGSPDGHLVAHAPLRHRSPPIEKPSERRLFLAIDPAPNT
jgi:hypothetical protein